MPFDEYIALFTPLTLDAAANIPRSGDHETQVQGFPFGVDLTVQDVAFEEVIILFVPPDATATNKPSSGDHVKQFQFEAVSAVYPVQEVPFEEVMITFAPEDPQATNKPNSFTQIIDVHGIKSKPDPATPPGALPVQVVPLDE